MPPDQPATGSRIMTEKKYIAMYTDAEGSGYLYSRWNAIEEGALEGYDASIVDSMGEASVFTQRELDDYECIENVDGDSLCIVNIFECPTNSLKTDHIKFCVDDNGSYIDNEPEFFVQYIEVDDSGHNGPLPFEKLAQFLKSLNKCC